MFRGGGGWVLKISGTVFIYCMEYRTHGYKGAVKFSLIFYEYKIVNIEGQRERERERGCLWSAAHLIGFKGQFCQLLREIPQVHAFSFIVRKTNPRNTRHSSLFAVKPLCKTATLNKTKMVFKTNCRLTKVKSIAECFQPSLSYHLSLRFLFCLFLSGCFTQVYCIAKLTFLILKSSIFTSSFFIAGGALLGVRSDTLLPPRWLGPWYSKLASLTGSASW